MFTLSKDQLGGLLILVFALAYVSQIGSIPVLDSSQAITPQSMPIFLAGLAIPLSLWMLLPRLGERPSFNGLNWKLLLVFMVLMLIYSVGLRAIGFIPSSTLFLTAGFLLLGSRHADNKARFLITSAAIALAAAIALWLLMDRLLGIYVQPLPW